MAIHEVAVRLAAETGRCAEALEELRAELGEDAVEEPDEETGMFAVEAEAATFDEAVQEVRDVIAAIGADECFEFGESSGCRASDPEGGIGPGARYWSVTSLHSASFSMHACY